MAYWSSKNKLQDLAHRPMFASLCAQSSHASSSSSSSRSPTDITTLTEINPSL